LFRSQACFPAKLQVFLVARNGRSGKSARFQKDTALNTTGKEPRTTNQTGGKGKRGLADHKSLAWDKKEGVTNPLGGANEEKKMVKKGRRETPQT